MAYDRGSQYASYSHRAILKEHQITQSMSRKGNCWDNAVSESFFHTLERVHHCQFKTREEAQQAIFEYIEVFYNRERIHSANDVCHQWTMKFSNKLCNFVSEKVLTHHILKEISYPTNLNLVSN